MATINGNIQRRATLTPNEETIIRFVHDIRSLSICVVGGTILFKINDPISGLDDLSANKLLDGGSFDTVKNGPITELYVISSEPAEIQWDVP